MAELATIARPYAEALNQSSAEAGVSLRDLAEQLDALAQIASNDELLRFAGGPKVTSQQVVDVVSAALGGVVLSPHVQNLLRAMVDNGRLAAVPEVATQYRSLLNQSTGIADATIFSAFPIESGQTADVIAALERRFGRKLNATVQVDPELIGGLRAVVGDEVFDTSVKARLEQMKAALTA